MRRSLTLMLSAILVVMAVSAVIPVLAADGDRTVVAWGDNAEGQTDVPAGLTGVQALDGGGQFSLALNADGTVAAWGSNFNGQASVPAGLTDVAGIAAGSGHSLALKSDGTVVAWGYDLDGQATVPSGLVDVVAVAAGGWHSLALKSDGTVVAWGLDFRDQATVPVGLTDVVAIAAGAWHSLALKSDGTVVAWGSNYEGQTTIPDGLAGVAAIAGGEAFSLALKSDGTVVAWGDNTEGQIDVPVGLSDVVAVAAGGWHSLALKADGTLVGWGYNGDGQIEIPSGITDLGVVAAGRQHSLVTAVVFDPDGGFVTGGGWIESPEGAPHAVGLPFYDGSYYELVSSPLNWDDADIAANTKTIDACSSVHLATVTSAGEQAVLSALMAGSPVNAWIGGFQPPDALDADAGWQWVTGEPFGFTNWSDGEPNDSPYGMPIDGSEQHLEAYQVSGVWNDAPGTEEKPFVVEYDDCRTRKATFGFVAKYKKGTSVPTGNSVFQVHSGDLVFLSTSYDWLVVDGNDSAMFMGMGTINGEGAYRFQVWVGDGESDTFRIRIWSEDEFGLETVLYDNLYDQVIGGGSVVIHSKK